MSLLRLFNFFPIKVNYLLGIIIGEILYRLMPSRRKVTEINLRRCFPHWHQNKVKNTVRSHFHKLAVGLLYTSYAWWSHPEKLKSMCRYTNFSVFENCIKNNKNIILLGPHFCSLEFLGILLSIDVQICSMYQKHKNPALDQAIFERRSRFGIILHNFKDIGPSLIKSIRHGMPFYYLPDQDPGRKKGIFVNFFNIPTSTYPALSKLISLSDAVVVPCMAKILDRGKGLEIIFHNSISDFPVNDSVATATQMNTAIENLIIHAPEQYLWSHKRFKTRPEGEQSFYK